MKNEIISMMKGINRSISNKKIQNNWNESLDSKSNEKLKKLIDFQAQFSSESKNKNTKRLFVERSVGGDSDEV